MFADWRGEARYRSQYLFSAKRDGTSHGRERPQLHADPQHVGLEPPCMQLTVDKSPEDHLLHRHGSAGWRDAAKRAQMRAVQREPHGHPVALTDDIVDRPDQVGERLAEGGHVPLDRLSPVADPGNDVVWMNHLVRDLEMARVPHLRDQADGGGFVRLDRHGGQPILSSSPAFADNRHWPTLFLRIIPLSPHLIGLQRLTHVSYLLT